MLVMVNDDVRGRFEGMADSACWAVVDVGSAIEEEEGPPGGGDKGTSGIADKGGIGLKGCGKYSECRCCTTGVATREACCEEAWL